MFLDNQQERFVTNIPNTESSKWFISGFVDGEGSFCLNIKNRINVKYGFRIEPAFYVYQHEKNKWFLEEIMKVFGCGSIHRKTSPYSVYTYQISGINPCYERVIPFFETYPLKTKLKAFSIFRDAIVMMKNKQHLSPKGMLKLLDYSYEMNQMGKGKKWEKKELVARILRG